MVKESFTSCAITTATDDSDDGKIHCFKAGPACEGGLSLLKDETQKLLQDSTIQHNNQDPFAAGEDEGETTNNEACIDLDGYDAEESGSSEFSDEQDKIWIMYAGAYHLIQHHLIQVNFIGV